MFSRAHLANQQLRNTGMKMFLNGGQKICKDRRHLCNKCRPHGNDLKAFKDPSLSMDTVVCHVTLWHPRVMVRIQFSSVKNSACCKINSG